MAAHIFRQALKLRALNALPPKPQAPCQIQLSRNAVTNQSGSFLPEPERQSYGLLGVTVTVMVGLMIGANISQSIASFLEENELFVPSDDDDDDD
ncbi:hypothetical protein B566_EDAN006443 [Ephemera danica]|nr:hypothetical protein B566_EDAN006443 [Ephemera danica]